MNISGKSIIVTGAAAGIGRAAAIQFAKKGAARVIVVDIDDEGMTETARLVTAAGAITRTEHIDLADISSLESWLVREAATDGGYDILYNNAGIVSGTPQFPEAGARKIKLIVDVNLTSLMTTTEIALAAMKSRGGGVIVNTVSTVALGNGFTDVLYSATKAGAHMFVKACSPMQETHNVRVLGVLPGLTDTPILLKTGANGEAASWMQPVLENYERCTPDDIADAVMDLVERDDIPGGSWVAVRRTDGKVEREWSECAI
ncbi:SDR family NAD(P)-dependent oxidoreductase [Hyphomonas sp.]|uniref:SDR family NAD(P)-dependent oxidoreductase n=1 Tax=Hyphomonas sp. TaxID=87 RepID=UPI0035668905